MGLPRGHGFGFTGSQESRIGIEAERQRESAVSRQEKSDTRMWRRYMSDQELWQHGKATARRSMSSVQRHPGKLQHSALAWGSASAWEDFHPLTHTSGRTPFAFVILRRASDTVLCMFSRHSGHRFGHTSHTVSFYDAKLKRIYLHLLVIFKQMPGKCS